MEQMTRTILVEQELLKEMNGYLESNDFVEDCGDDEILWIGTASFPDQFEVDIKVCNGDGPYVDPVLFQDNDEVLSIGVTDRLDGEYIFYFNNKEFVVLVDAKNE